VSFENYKVVLYRNQPERWVAEIPSIAGCHALMPTEEEALVELANVYQMIVEEGFCEVVGCRS
jgi:predicted RNase H-like HicB family nuclease